MADDRKYLAPHEFARLTSDEQHAVWDAHLRGQVEAVPASPTGSILRYHRAQVLAVLSKAEGAGRG